MNKKPNLPTGTFESSSFHPPRGLARNGVVGRSSNYKTKPAPWANLALKNEDRNARKIKKLEKARYKAVKTPHLTCCFNSAISLSPIVIPDVFYDEIVGRTHGVRACGFTEPKSAVLSQILGEVFHVD